MVNTLKDFRPVYVVGIGLHRYQKLSEKTYVDLGLTAVRAALDDAKMPWEAVGSVYHGNALLGMAPTRAMLRHLGGTGIAMTQVENASATGSSAVRQAAQDVAAGFSDVSLALGLDKPAMVTLAPSKTGIRGLDSGRIVPFTHFALLADAYMERSGATPEEIASVAVKNAKNGSKNPFAHRQKERTLEDVMEGPAISGSLTRLQCCPVGEGAAAVLIASEAAIKELGLDASRAVRIASSVQKSERIYEAAGDYDAELTRETMVAALEDAQIEVTDLDVLELHDAFTVEELLYIEAMGLAKSGQGAAAVASGEFDIGGSCAVSASGGLLSMGHPIGPTGVGQIVEVTRQLRSEAGDRQHRGAKLGLAHMLGIGAVSLAHVLVK
jgi:acetyl-CoA acetyltransferase